MTSTKDETPTMSRLRRALSVAFWTGTQAWRCYPAPCHVHVIGDYRCDEHPACRDPS